MLFPCRDYPVHPLKAQDVLRSVKRLVHERKRPFDRTMMLRGFLSQLSYIHWTRARFRV